MAGLEEGLLTLCFEFRAGVSGRAEGLFMLGLAAGVVFAGLVDGLSIPGFEVGLSVPGRVDG
jgi:hypothetical protein